MASWTPLPPHNIKSHISNLAIHSEYDSIDEVVLSDDSELWAIYVELQLTWEKGFRKVILESDSKVVVGIINEDNMKVDRNYNLVMQIKDMLGRDWEVRTIHIYREANCVADWLTNFGLTLYLIDRGSDIITDPSAEIYILLYYDLIGSTISRLI
uniref:RNase H type-1 domain-containing protein n=1 Tax=Salix viminalis TaxID=40686 RepID=A0A6N2L8Y9_SALVM